MHRSRCIVPSLGLIMRAARQNSPAEATNPTPTATPGAQKMVAAAALERCSSLEQGPEQLPPRAGA